MESAVLSHAEALADGFDPKPFRVATPGLSQQHLELIDEVSAVAEPQTLHRSRCVDCSAALAARNRAQQILEISLVLEPIGQVLHRNEVPGGDDRQSESAPFFNTREPNDLTLLVPPPKTHLTSFHGDAPHATLRPSVTGERTLPASPKPPPAKPKRPRLDWATLHQHTFGNDVLRCPCGGRRTIRALFSTHHAAEQRLAVLGQHVPSRLLPNSTAPPQLAFAV